MQTVISESKKTTPFVIPALVGIIVAGATLRLYQIGDKRSGWTRPSASGWSAIRCRT